MTNPSAELMTRIRQYAQSSTHSPRQIAELLSDEYSEDEVFEAIDELQYHSEVWFDVENDVLIPAWKPKTIKMAPQGVMNAIYSKINEG